MPLSQDPSPSSWAAAGPYNDSIQGAPDQQESAPQSLLAVAFNAVDISTISHSPSVRLHSNEPDDLKESTSPETVTSTTTKPIRIPTRPVFSLAALDPDRVPTNTPLSARGTRKDFYFYYPFPRTPSTPDRRNRAVSDSHRDYSPPYSPNKLAPAPQHRRYSTSSSHTLIFAMRSDSYAGRYTPTSPLSPQIPSSSHPLAPQSSKRSTHARQTSRNMHMPLPRFHPMAYPHHGQAASPTSNVQSPAIAVTNVHGVHSIDSPRMMRQKHREFLDSAKAMSVQAASPASNKPDSPRLDPLGSPKGNVTPLLLEEGGDYFTVKRPGKHSPVVSPGAKSARSDASSGREELAKNKRKVDAY